MIGEPQFRDLKVGQCLVANPSKFRFTVLGISGETVHVRVDYVDDVPCGVFDANDSDFAEEDRITV